MKYISTRGNAPILNFEEALLTGLASDGGLYLPESWPKINTSEIPKGKYWEKATFIMLPFVGNFLSEQELLRLTKKAYSHFPSDEVAPLRKLKNNKFLLELYHGPTLAFKDFAMLLLAELFDAALEKKGKKITILGATSGDTGSAAIEAFKNNNHADVFILFPKGRVSETQRRQMTTVSSKSVYPIEIDGTFDDCQNLVKSLFQEKKFREETNLAAINSINWGRVAAQIVYYFTSFELLGEEKVSFSVPTGNFGDILAGWVAQKMGLPISQLIVATNENDILNRAILSGDYSLGKVNATISPSMDIQISSNFERMLFEAYNRDSKEINSLMNELVSNRGFTIKDTALNFIKNDFISKKASEEDTKKTIRKLYKEENIIIDPHTAVGLFAANEIGLNETSTISLGTAHPAKFPEAVFDVLNVYPEIPKKLEKCLKGEEKFTTMDKNPNFLKEYIRENL
ncbi:MAG: threonine synthase [Pseudomonadota bacterium]|nr:threonine synthase [Pseudomonadota bacterium]